MNMSEVWKDINDYENLYQVSNYGRVKSLPKRVGFYIRGEKILNENIDTYGYSYVVLSKDNKIKVKLIHRLVAEAFIPNPNNLPQVNHKDTNKKNNNITNLEWCTDAYNKEHAWKNGLYKVTRERRIVQQYTKEGVFINEYNKNIKNVAKQFGTTAQQIYKCCRGVIKSTGGYIWKFK